MSGITFDSLQFVETLVEAGVSEVQAKAQAKAINTAFKQFSESKELATKADISGVKTDIAAIRHEMQVMEERMTSNLYKAMLLQTFAMAGLVIAVVKFMG